MENKDEVEMLDETANEELKEEVLDVEETRVEEVLEENTPVEEMLDDNKIEEKKDFEEVKAEEDEEVLEDVKPVEDVLEEVKAGEEEIIFKDDVVENTKQVIEKGPLNRLAVVSLVCAILSIIVAFIPSSSSIFGLLYLVLLVCGLVLAIVSLVQIKKKNQTGTIFAVFGLIGVFVSFVVPLIVGIIEISNMPEEEMNDLIYCPYVTDCVDNKDGTSTCLYVNNSEVKCSTDILKDNQFK